MKLSLSFLKSFGARSNSKSLGLSHIERLTPSRPEPLGKRPGEANQRIPQPIMLVLVVASLTSIVGYRFYNQPSLKEGTISPRTLWALDDVAVTDADLTADKRKAVQTGLVQVLKIDLEATAQMREDIAEFLEEVAQMRQLAGPFPFTNDRYLSLPTQRYIRSAGAEQWQTILQALKQAFGKSLILPESIDLNAQNTNPKDWEIRQVIAELEVYGSQQGVNRLSGLLGQIWSSRVNYSSALARFAMNTDTAPRQKYKRALLDLRQETWEQTRAEIERTSERILAQGLAPGLPDQLEAQAIALQLQNEVPALTAPIITQLLGEMLKPNLVQDPEKTKDLAEQAAQKVEPVVYRVKRETIIVKAGEKIDRKAFVLLDYFKQSGRRIDWRGLIITAGIVTLGVGIFWLVKLRLQVRLRSRDRILLCLLGLSTPLLVVLNVEQTNLAAVGLLVGSFYHPVLAATQVTIMAGLSLFSLTTGGTIATTSLPWAPLLAGTAGGLLAAIVAGRSRTREELAFLGGAVAIAQGSVYLIVTLLGSATATTVWAVVLPGAALFGLSGLVWCIVALGLSPYLERGFDLITPIRLSELSSPNRPLLQRLALEAPGTFQHTLFVASLAEAAARELHCNVELVRAGTLYHDIGKMHDPLGFIENQMGGQNKHDIINDPFQSAQIIKKHVSEGLVIAKKYGLPKAIRNFIPEHQGTILISYFYFQAKQRAQAEGLTLDEADFRYDGPIPQSRETGIVMLADACEAALRSLKEATPEMALNMVNKIFRARWQDAQLAESGLKREELSIIADIFVGVWQQYHHQRITYPKGALEVTKNCGKLEVEKVNV